MINIYIWLGLWSKTEILQVNEQMDLKSWKIKTEVKKLSKKIKFMNNFCISFRKCKKLQRGLQPKQNSPLKAIHTKASNKLKTIGISWSKMHLQQILKFVDFIFKIFHIRFIFSQSFIFNFQQNSITFLYFFIQYSNLFQITYCKKNMKQYPKFNFLLICFAIVCGNTLVIRENPDETHLTSTQKLQALKLVHMKFYSTLHFAGASATGDIDQSGPFGDFFQWLMADKDILKSVMAGSPLSQKSAKKVKNYLMEHPEVIESFIPQSPGGSDDFSRCMGKFNPKQKKKFYGLFLDELDFKNMFVKNGDLGKIGDDKTSKISKKILADKQLGPAFTACVAQKKL